MKCCICKRVLVSKDGAIPFVRIYGWSRRVPLLHTYDGRETVGERDGWVDTPGSERPPERPPHDPKLTGPWLDGEISFHEHPLACILDCSMRLMVQLDDEEKLWERDDKTYTEPTATTIMRVRDKT